jgi:alkylation response protein AidB-like acyl-CoA dehydrogenase
MTGLALAHLPVRTTVSDGDHYILNGAATFITGGFSPTRSSWWPARRPT